jgi:hypothetical protein
MSFKSFDFFVQRTTTTGTLRERDVTRITKPTRKDGKLGRASYSITCPTTGILEDCVIRRTCVNFLGHFCCQAIWLAKSAQSTDQTGAESVPQRTGRRNQRPQTTMMLAVHFRFRRIVVWISLLPRSDQNNREPMATNPQLPK